MIVSVSVTLIYGVALKVLQAGEKAPYSRAGALKRRLQGRLEGVVKKQTSPGHTSSAP